MNVPVCERDHPAENTAQLAAVVAFLSPGDTETLTLKHKSTGK